MALPPGISVQLIGPWGQTGKDLSSAKKKKMIRAFLIAARPYARVLRNMIKKGYKSAKPPLAASTILARKQSGRGGRKPLFVSGDMRNSVSVVKEDDALFVGIHRNKKGHGGNMVNLATLHEFGKTFAAPATRRSKAFLTAMFRNPKILKSTAKFFVITIPARPVFGPAFKNFESKHKKNMLDSISTIVQRRLFGSGFKGKAKA